MHEFTVWAPAASSVTLHLPGLDRREPMQPAEGGWWSLDVSEAGHGTDYGYAVDGGEPRPDPRSGWQPGGVHGPSRVFDTTRHPWSDAEWPGRSALGAVFYELHVGTFTPEGTLDAAIDRLDHLVWLGVDIVELLPLAGFPGTRGWGYDGVNMYAVHDPYGGPAALQRFVDAAHGRGLGVCLDVVYNHLGPDGNYLAEFGPYFTGAHQTPWGEAVNLDDDGSTGVRDWIIDNAVRWFADFHLDCLRVDAVHALVDTSERHLLVELSEQVAALADKLGRPLGLVAESDLNDPAMIEPTHLGGCGMTAQWDDDVHHALHALLTGERQGYYGDFGTTSVLAQVLTRAFRHAGDYSSFRGRHWGRPIDPAKHAGHRFVVSLQTHDQIGNRATGDRLTGSLRPGRLAAGAALLLTSAYTPMLFMGEEWGACTPWQFFTSYETDELADAVRRGRRSEFAAHGWSAQEIPDPQDPATRDRSVLDWSELDRVGPAAGGGELDHRRLLTWYRDLIALRRRSPELMADDLREVEVEIGETWIAVHRGPFSILVNLGPDDAVLATREGAVNELGWGDVGWSDVGWSDVGWRDAGGRDAGGSSPSSRDGSFRVGPDSVAVLTAPQPDVWVTLNDEGAGQSARTAQRPA